MLFAYAERMKIYLARHCRTNYNDLGLCNADPAVDVHLTPEGIKQAENFAEKFKNISIDHIFVSQLKRTQQTAEKVNAFHNVEIEPDARLNDGRSGFEGKPFQEFDAALAAAPDRWTARFNDGESIEDIKKRVAEFIKELKTKNYDSVLIVTSLWIVQAILAVLDDISYEQAWSIDAPQGGWLEREI